MNSIILRICEKSSEPFLQLINANGTMQAEEPLPADLRLPAHSGDYTTYREFLLKEENEDPKFSDIGQHLFALLHLGEVGREWDKLARKELHHRVLLDIEISATVNRNIARLPWELIFDGTNRRFQKKNAPIVRIRNYHDQEAPNIEPINWPIRLLIIVGVDDTAIAAAEEIQIIEDALRKVNRLIDVEVVESPPDVDELEAACKHFKPHIFHYIGHGGIDPNENAYIRLRGPNGDVPWLANDIIINLDNWEWLPRFAFINACRTSGGATTGTQIGAWGIADAFNSLRIPAVLTMQANIDGKMAGRFAGSLYENLALGECIDRAMVAARIKLRSKIHATDRDNKRDWATPTLTISLPPEKILPLQEKTSAQHKPDVKACPKFREVDILANCKDERRKFIHGFYPIIPSPSQNNVVLVHGSKASGKTWVTLWCLEACALIDHNVRHVEVVSDASPKWLHVLRRIQAGDANKAVGDRVIYGPLKEEAFYEFNHDLHYRINSETPPPWDPTKKFPFEEDLDLTQLDTLPPDTIKHIFTSFRKALRRAAEPNNPLTIVLDQWSYGVHRIAPSHMEKYLIPYLFTKAASGDLSSPDGRSVKLVLVMSDDELEEMYPELKNKLDGSFHDVHLRGIPAEHFEKVAKEFFHILRSAGRSGISNKAKKLDEEDEKFFIKHFGKDVYPTWHPSRLGEILWYVEKLL
jgi:hypothetical protein